MGYRTLETAVCIDKLKEGDDPTYEVPSADVWYLGLNGELASEVKCSKITLPMLSKEKYDWKKEFKKALSGAISLKPQKHVESIEEACLDASKKLYEIKDEYGWVEDPKHGTWYANKDTNKELRSKANYDLKYGYYIIRRGLVLDIPKKVIAITPKDYAFCYVPTSEKYFNFCFVHDYIHVYYLNTLNIDKTA